MAARGFRLGSDVLGADLRTAGSVSKLHDQQLDEFILLGVSQCAFLTLLHQLIETVGVSHDSGPIRRAGIMLNIERTTVSVVSQVINIVNIRLTEITSMW